MKRIITSLLAVLYLSLASGVTVHAHYCMGQLIGAGLTHAGTDDGGEHICGLCGMEKGSDDGGCCHDEEVSFKVNEAQKGAVSVPASIVHVTDVPAPLFHPASQRALPLRDVAANFSANAPPPRPPAVPIFLRVCSFRI